MQRLERLVEDATQATPNAIAIHDAEGETTYAELDCMIERIRGALARLGVRRGQRVGIWLDKSARAIAGMQAALRLGAAYVPLDPSAPLARIQSICRDAEFSAILTSEARASKLDAADESRAIRETPLLIVERSNEGELHLDEQLRDAPAPALTADFERPDAAALDDLAYILYTSGSTGTPKGVCISHRNAEAFVEWAYETLEARADDRLANHAPFHFDLSVLDLYVAFRAGASVHLVPDGIAYAPQRLVQFIEERRISIWYSVPSALMLMMDQGQLLESQSVAWRAILFAGEVFPIRHLRRLYERFPEARFLNLYGPTETNVCTYYEVRSIAEDRIEPVPIGQACSGDRVYALRPDGTVAGVGEEGELVVTGPTVCLGYFGKSPQGSAPYRTGDIVRLEEDGNYVYVARRDHMVKVRGHRIELGDIEAALQTSDQIREAAVVVRGEGMQARLRAFIVANGDATPSLLDCKRLCAARLPRYMIVDEVHALAELPRTRNGKVDRKALQALAARATEARHSSPEPPPRPLPARGAPASSASRPSPQPPRALEDSGEFHRVD